MSRRSIVSLTALVIGAAAAPAGAEALRECMQGCRVVQGGCVEDAQQAYETARAACDATGGGRKCAKSAKTL